MNHRIFLPTFTTLAILSLCSCVDPYYGGSYSYSGSATFTTLPYGYHTIYVGSTPYYYFDNRWYRRSGSHYVICPRPHGYHGSLGKHHHYRSVSRLPYGCRTTYVHGHRYYTHGDTWYRKSGSGYVTCPKPSGHTGHRHQDRHSSYKHRDDGKKHSSDHHRHPSVKPGDRKDHDVRRPGAGHRSGSSLLHNRSEQKSPPRAFTHKRRTSSVASSHAPAEKTASTSSAKKNAGLPVTSKAMHRPEKAKSASLTRHRGKFARERD